MNLALAVQASKLIQPPLRLLILLADSALAELVSRALNPSLVNSTTVASEDAARTALQAGTYDLLLTDACWPAGVQIGARAREMQSDLVVVALLADGPARVAIEAQQAGVSGFIPNPFTPTQLNDGLCQALQRESGQREASGLRALIPLYELSQAFMRETDINTLLNQVLELALRETGAERGSLMLIDPAEGNLRIFAAVGLPPEVVINARETIGQGIAGWVAQTGRALIVNGERDVPEFLRHRLRGGAARSAICLPLTVHSQIIGVLNLTKESITAPPFNRRHADLLSVLAAQAAIAIENAQLFSRMEAAYDELRRLDQFKSQFISIAAHELRTPVAIILGFSNLLAEDRTLSHHPLVEPILRYAQQLHAIVDALFQASNLTSLEVRSSFQKVDLTSVVQSAVKSMSAQATEKSHDLQVNLPSEPVMVLGDSAKLGIILGNLLSNAIKFTPPNGSIVVDLCTRGNEAQLSVTDNGVGIPSSERERIFNKFYQVEPSETRQHGGLGLGLTIAGGLVELHHGRIWVDPHIEEGAKLCVALPLAASE